MKTGDTFDSYEQFTEVLWKYCAENYVFFYKRESRTVEAAKKKTGRYINPELKFYQLKYACIKGGRKFKSTGSGLRNSNTYKDGCNAHILLRASKCGEKLVVTNMMTRHNHEVSEKLYKHLPQPRRLPEDLNTEIKKMTKLKSRKKHLKSSIENKYNIVILLRDINHVTKKGKNLEYKSNDLQNSLQKLGEKYGGDCHTFFDCQNSSKGLFFQTENMKQYMETYPEFICIDSTYKLLDVKTPILLIVSQDGNGLIVVVAVAILVEENSASMQWLCSKFKEHNPKWTRIKSIIADIDTDEILLKSNFPDAQILRCIFHAKKIFNAELSTKDLNISPGQRQTALEILQKMVDCRDISAYNQLYEELQKRCPLTIVDYFHKKWHCLRDKWALGENFHQSNFLNTLTNRVESLNSKIKSIVDRYSTFQNLIDDIPVCFIDDFFKLVTLLNVERDQKAANMMYKVPHCIHEKGSVLELYSFFLTNYAFDFIKEQLESTNNGNFETTTVSCTCTSRTSMLLPCGHIFQERSKEGLNLYDENLCDPRWSRHFNQQGLLSIQKTKCERRRITEPVMLNQHQKLSKAWVVLKSIADLVSDKNPKEYHWRLRQLMQIKTAWESDCDVKISVSERWDGKNIEEEVSDEFESFATDVQMENSVKVEHGFEEVFISEELEMGEDLEDEIKIEDVTS